MRRRNSRSCGDSAGNGQIIHGHTAGARDQKLCAIAAVGVSSCHEPIRFEDALERLRLGYWTMLREGSLRQDLDSDAASADCRGRESSTIDSW